MLTTHLHGEFRNAYTILVGMPEEKGPLERHRHGGWITLSEM
jgi:hypothetical protein